LGVLAATAFYRRRLNSAMLATAAVITVWSLVGANSWSGLVVAWLLYGIVFVPFCHGPLRRAWLTAPALSWFRAGLRELSASERTALQAGTVGWEAQLFSGLPDWQQLDRLPPAQLSATEQAFMDGPLQTLLNTMAANMRADSATQPQPLTAAIWRQLRTD